MNGFGGLGELDLLAQPTWTDPANGQTYSIEAGSEVMDISLLASENKVNLSQVFPRDSDFLWTGICGTQTGIYQVQFVRPDGRQLSSAAVRNANMIGTAQFPVPIWPAVRVRAGQSIGVHTITDLSVAANTIQIVFLGVRLYRLK